MIDDRPLAVATMGYTSPNWTTITFDLRLIKSKKQ